MRVLLLGSGAKDHAVAWWFSKSCYLSELFAAPGNLATGRFCTNLPDVNPSDPIAVYETCRKHRIDFVFIGTEQPLFTGVVKYLNEKGIRTFGATENAVKIEGDRSFSRAFTSRHNIPIPHSSLFGDIDGLKKYLEKHSGEHFTIKSNFLSPSRIMLSSNDTGALLDYSRQLFQKGPVLLEEYVHGVPASCSLLLDRNGYLVLPITSDYTKKAADDQTPTGGMGALCPIPIIDEIKEKIIERIIKPTLYGMQVEQLSYKGLLTLSLMITPDKEPYLVDYHVRLNDPSAQAMIPIINTDIIEILSAMENDDVSSVELSTTDECTVAVVLAAEGYPMAPKTGMEVKGLTSVCLEPLNDGPVVFCGAVQERDGKAITTGGRILTVVGKGNSIGEANRNAYDLIKGKHFQGLWYRDDIGNAYFSD